MKHKHILAIILILALLLRIIFALIVPVFEKPDEKSHFEYINFIIENKKLPIQKEGQYSAEFFQPPFYHYFASFILRFVKNLTDNQSYQVVAMRFLSIFVSMFTLYTIYKIASFLFKDNSLILGIVAFSSFLPSHINMNSTVTNANFADFLSTLIIYILLIILTKNKVENKLIVILGFVTGISLITRLSLLPIIMVIPFVFLIKHYPNIKKILKPLVIIFLIALLISGWNFIRNFTLYGDFLGYNAMKLAAPPDNREVNLIWVGRLLGWTFITFWASFGRTNGVFVGNLNSINGILYFVIFYSSLLVISLLSLYGLCKFFKKYKSKNNLLGSRQKNAFIVLMAHLGLLLLAFVALNSYNFQPQGRLLFPAISTLSIIFTFGVYNLFNNYKNKFLPIYFASFILIDVLSIISVIQYY